MDKNKYNVRIALVVLMLLVFAGVYTSYNAYKNSPEGKAKAMERAQEQLLAEIAEDQAQVAEGAKKLIEEMATKKAEQEKIYQAYLLGAKMDQAELNRIQDRLKNLEYCQAMMSYECFTQSTASGAPVSSAPSHRYSLITTAYASDNHSNSLMLDRDTHALNSTNTPSKSSGKTPQGPRTSPLITRGTDMQAPAGSKRIAQADRRNQLESHASLTPQGQETARSQALEMIRKYEGLRLTAYPDGNGYSIGYGSRSYAGEKISKEEVFSSTYRGGGGGGGSGGQGGLVAAIIGSCNVDITLYIDVSGGLPGAGGLASPNNPTRYATNGTAGSPGNPGRIVIYQFA